MKRILLSVVLVTTILLGFAVNTSQVRADVNYDGVSLDELYEMKDDPEELAKVTGIYAVSMEGYQNADEKLEIVKQCPNLR
ncbi:MAG: hypothetical protein K5779_00985 [Saccharofermentans sp.]|nr:hypothetical protein [Saccharofermentans sp.]